MILPNPAIVADLEQLQKRVWRSLHTLDELDYPYTRTGTPEEEREWAAETACAKSEERETVAALTDSLATRTAVYADALGLPETQRLIRDWRASWPQDRLAETKHWSTSEADGVESPAFTALSQILDPILVLTRPADAPPPDPELRRGIDVLEHALRSLAKLCRDRQVVPSRESEVQKVLHSHLEGMFPDYVRTPTISKPLLSFEPDGGIPSLRAAIECKYIATDVEVKTAIHGLTEDLSGYAGSTEWTRFYSVCYMTEAFTVEGSFSAALGSSGNAGSWTTILVTGAGSRGRRGASS